MALSLGVLLTPIGMLAVLVLISILVLVAYMLYSRRPITEVLLLRPRDKRGLTVPVVLESDIGLTCKKTGGIVRRFIKAGCSWTFASKTKVVTRFLGLEGTAYSAIVRGQKQIKLSLEQVLRLAWDDDFYERLPPERKKPIEKDKWGITIEVEPVKEEGEELVKISSDDVHDAAETVILDKISKAQKSSKKMEVYQFIMGAIAGAFIMYLAVMQGWL